MPNLLFYDRSAGVSELYRPTGPGQALDRLHRFTGWRKTWSLILPGNFSGSNSTVDLLLYDAENSQIEIIAIDHQGDITRIGRHQEFRQWTDIVAGNFFRGPKTDLLFYERSEGMIRMVSIRDDGEFVRRLFPWGQNWSQIVAGRLTRSSQDDVLFYDQPLGQAELYTPGGGGTPLDVPKERFVWRKSWSQIEYANVDTQGGFVGGLVFYDAQGGEGEFLTNTGPGNKFRRKAYFDDWRTTWTHIVPLGEFSSRLLFYDASRGDATLYRLGDRFDIHQWFGEVASYGNVGTNWTHVVGLPDLPQEPQEELGPDEHTFTYALQPDIPHQGVVPYVLLWDPGPPPNAQMKSMSTLDYENRLLHIMKRGKPWTACNTADGSVTLRGGQTAEGDDLLSIFGSRRPRPPLQITACITEPNIGYPLHSFPLKIVYTRG